MAKEKSPRQVLAELRKKENADKTVIGSLNDFDLKPKGLPTGNISLDEITGSVGFPLGRITECYGERSSGKTTAALMSMAKEQARIKETGEDKILVFFDYERTLDPVYMKALGLDVEDEETFVYVKPRTLEHGMNMFRSLGQTGLVSMAVFDSVAAMVSEQELAKETGEVTVADRAKALHQSMRQIVGMVEEQQIAAVFLNHVMEAIPTGFMEKKMAANGVVKKAKPGGKALDYYASLQLEFKRLGEVKATDFDVLANEKTKQILGQKVLVTVAKNKTGAAFGSATLRVRQSRGFSQAYSVLTILNNYDVVPVKTGWYSWPVDLLPDILKSKAKEGVYRIQGEEVMLSALESSPEWLALAETEARKTLDHVKAAREGVVLDDGEFDGFDEEGEEA